eukprot:CAMPEP_0170541492 /NCGR_PEP_ID=MMETSP0211-20121228/1214_1 /TAXON_ID=311385 /ORGANISM="Pseudokeronopsis sp., Strain OXSARD2" /LENGTH=95 /DNA_ID=CAMNT_0010844247 /DNA_START=32 /DNA_END=319 /DNA_ORIENTATION=+
MTNNLPTLFFLSALFLAASAADIDYSNNGTDWSAGICNSGASQSPIDIPASASILDSPNANFVTKTDKISFLASYDRLTNLTVSHFEDMVGVAFD